MSRGYDVDESAEWVAQGAVFFLHWLCLQSFVAVVYETESASEVNFYPSIGLARLFHACVKINKEKSLRSNHSLVRYITLSQRDFACSRAGHDMGLQNTRLARQYNHEPSQASVIPSWYSLFFGKMRRWHIISDLSPVLTTQFSPTFLVL